jgi:hypothetical protein
MVSQRALPFFSSRMEAEVCHSLENISRQGNMSNVSIIQLASRIPEPSIYVRRRQLPFVTLVTARTNVPKRGHKLSMSQEKRITCAMMKATTHVAARILIQVAHAVAELECGCFEF